MFASHTPLKFLIGSLLTVTALVSTPVWADNANRGGKSTGAPTLAAHGDNDCGAGKATPQLTLAQRQAHLEKLLKPVPNARAGSFEEVSRLLSRKEWNSLAPIHRQMIAGMLSTARRGGVSPEFCFAAGTDPKVMSLMGRVNSSLRPLRIGGRWTETANNPTTTRGKGFTLTWNIVADGTPVNTNGKKQVSSLRARIRAAFGTTDDTKLIALYTKMFKRYEDLTGIRYVYEPKDDGIQITDMTDVENNGIKGVRADVRISGASVDGPSNTLAFNFFPNSGDMVVDTDEPDSFFNDAQFLNTISHEHGHGLGLNHACPDNNSKLMEPTSESRFEGAQLDDVLGIQRNYGDTNETGASNDTPQTATPLGSFSQGSTNFGAFPSAVVASAEIVPSTYPYLTTQKPVGIDGSADKDVYSFSVDAGGRSAAITLRPAGENYIEGAQQADGKCGATTTIVPKTFSALKVELVNGAGTVLAQSASGVAGQNQIIPATDLTGTGPFYVRVSETGTDANQLYDFDLIIGKSVTAPLNNVPSLNNATYSTSINTPFSQQLAGTDADTGDVLTYKLVGVLPTGVTLSGTGLLSGTPTQFGQFAFSVDVSDGKDSVNARFILLVSTNADGVGPIITRDALVANYTRDALANIVLNGTVRDVAAAGVTPSGVDKMLFQLRRKSDGFAYSGDETTGFTSNKDIGYFPGFLSAPMPADTTGTHTFRRTFGANGFVPSATVLTPGDYSVVIVAKDKAGNYSVEVVPFRVVAGSAVPVAPATSSPSAARGATANAPRGSGGAS